MKRIIIAIIVISIILGVGIFELRYIEDTMEHIMELSSAIESSLLSDDIANANQDAKRLTAYYMERQKMLSFILSHKEIDELPLLIGELSSNISIEEKEQAIVKAHIITCDAKKLIDILSYSIENIL